MVSIPRSNPARYSASEPAPIRHTAKPQREAARPNKFSERKFALQNKPTPKIVNAMAVLGFITGKFGTTVFRNAISKIHPASTANDIATIATAHISVTKYLDLETMGLFIAAR